MNNYYIITNDTKDCGLRLTNRINEYLKKKNCIVHVGEMSVYQEHSYTDSDKIPADTECIIVVGGDGTLIQAARDLYDKDIPFIGVNMGTLGFLAEFDESNLEQALDRIVADEYFIEERIMLQGSIVRDGNTIAENIAWNDIVFTRGGCLRVIDFNVYVNGQFLKMYSADGMIISTPTGSTAYNLSAGGPILEPCANIISLSPICAHGIGSRSIVLSADSTVEIEICKKRHLSDEDSVVYFDGTNACTLHENDRIVVNKALANTRMIRLNALSFVERLNKKLKD